MPHRRACSVPPSPSGQPPRHFVSVLGGSPFVPDLPPAPLAVRVPRTPEPREEGTRHPLAGGNVAMPNAVASVVRSNRRNPASSPAPGPIPTRHQPFRAVIQEGGGCRAQAPLLVSVAIATATGRPEFFPPGSQASGWKERSPRPADSRSRASKV